MEGIVIRYEYDGDEAPWREAIDGFIAAIDADGDVRGRFSYSVNVAPDGKQRVHIGRWTEAAALETLQGRDYFKAFSATLQGLAGDTLAAVRVSEAAATGGLG